LKQLLQSSVCLAPAYFLLMRLTRIAHSDGGAPADWCAAAAYGPPGYAKIERPYAFNKLDRPN
jgi:hypothetical protein